MLITSWLQSLKDSLKAHFARPSRHRPRVRRRHRGRRLGHHRGWQPLQTIEVLEDRTLLSSVAVWDGAGTLHDQNGNVIDTADGTSWQDPLNWVGDTLPQAGDDVVIPDVTATTQVTFNGTASVHSVVSDEAFRISGGTLDADSIQVNNTFTMSGGTLKNATVERGSGGQAMLFASATTNAQNVLDGVTMNADLGLTGGSIISPGTAAVANIVNGLTLNGTAFLGDGNHQGQLVFTGTQTLAGNGTVQFNPGFGGRIYVDGTSTLTVGSGITVHGTGTIDNGRFVGGTDTLVNQGTISADVSGRSLNLASTNFTNAGTVQAANGGLLSLVPVPVNYVAGELIGGTWQAVGNSAVRLPTGSSITTNSANIVLDGVGSQLQTGSSDALAGLTTNAAGGSFAIRNGRDFATSGDFANAGGVVIGSASTFTANGGYTQTGGSTRLDGGTLVATGTVDVQGGDVGGAGRIDGNVVSAGQVAPGASPGTLVIDGDYTQQAAGTLAIELAGVAPGLFDVLQVTGTATLDGTLAVSLLNFDPAGGDQFAVLSFANRSGDFAAKTGLDLGNSKFLTADYSATDLTLTTHFDPLVVTNTNDSGNGSLRAALEYANSHIGADAITFAIPTSDPNFVDVDAALTGGDADPDAFIIHPLSALPALTDDGTTIDGRSQGTFGGDTNPFGPEVVLNGSSAGAEVRGLEILSNGNRIFGLNIQSFNSDGIRISGGDGNWIAGNFIGTDATGMAALGNGTAGLFTGSGVFIHAGAQFNLVGTDGDGVNDLAERNILSANSRSGVAIADAGSTSNIVAGNFIGTDAMGTAALGNAGANVLVDTGAQDNLVGTDGDGLADTAERNVISGGQREGILIRRAGTDRNVVAGNFVGTDVTGTVALGNHLNGIIISGGARLNQIGTDGDGMNDTAERNVISGNVASSGIFLADVGTERNVVAGNYIGTDATGTVALGNGAHGVLIQAGAKSNLVGTDGDGIADAAERNIISSNRLSGVQITGAGTDSNAVAGNYIGTNAAGTAGLGNQGSYPYAGVRIRGGARSNRVGTDGDGIGDAAERNLISANGFSGVFIHDAGTEQNVVAGNWIGTDVSGLLGLGNSGQGMRIENASNNLVGGTAPGAGNVIADNGGSIGIAILGTTATGNRVEGNFVGVGMDGSTPLGNHGEAGILIQDAVANTIGGDSVEARNVIAANSGQGVWIRGNTATGNRVQGNYIGTDATGTAALGNRSSGVLVSRGANSNLIGTNGDGIGDVAERNVISGNTRAGVWIAGAGTDSNTVAGNYIGTDVTGRNAIANGEPVVGFGGISIVDGARANVIGTNGDGAGDAVEGNLISGNSGFAGIFIGNAHETVIAGNLIGTDASGTAALGNQGRGIEIKDGSSSNRVGTNGDGTSDEAERNVISGNDNIGIWIWTQNSLQSTPQNVVAGNYIGTDVTGTVALGNRLDGVRIGPRANDNRIGTNGDGVNDAAEGNVISGNGIRGIRITGHGTDGNLVQGNYVGTDHTGTVALGNANDGVLVDDGAQDNRIDGNVVSGNGRVGVRVVGVGELPVFQWSTSDGGNGHYYVVVPGMNWPDSEEVAVAAGGHLASITSQEEQDFLETSVLGAFPTERFWIGLTDQENEGQFTWSSGEPLGFTNWHPGEPNNAGNQDFATFNFDPQSGTRGLWDDDSLGAAFRGLVELTAPPDFDQLQALVGTYGTRITGNRIGTSADGTAALGNTSTSVLLINAAQANIVGTDGDGMDDASEGNLIAASTAGHGVEIQGQGTDHNIVAGNVIGTDITGTQDFGNHFDGVVVWRGARFNRIGTDGDGTSDALERNLISGNDRYGVYILNPGSDDNTIAGNDIGTDAAGTVAIGNSSQGVRIEGADRTVVGTDGDGRADAAERNVISGNGNTGVLILPGRVDVNRLDVVDRLISGAIPSTTATATVAQADFTDPTFSAAGHWSFDNPVPGGGGNNYALLVTGTVQVQTAGTYTFAYSGDDGGRLRIDGRDVIVDDIGHTFRDSFGAVTLAAGAHALEWVTFEGGGAAGFELSVAAGAGRSGPVTAANDWHVLGDAGAAVALQGDLTATAYYESAQGGEGTVVAGNYIGTDRNGTAALANGQDGIQINNAANNRIGGVRPGEGNVISGNRNVGVWMVNPGATGNVVVGNLIGVDRTGTAALGNSRGMAITNGAAGNRVGTDGDGVSDAAERNVVSGNPVYGIRIRTNAVNNVIAGNYFGTDISGKVAIGNGDGIEILSGSQGNRIGTDGDGHGDAAERNVISGNASRGVWIADAGTDENVVAGNYIGTDATGNAPLGNGRWTVVIQSNAQLNRIGTDGNGVGDRDERNVISANGIDGVHIVDGANQNIVAGNYIGTNAAGTLPLGNAGNGVIIARGAHDNRIGTDGDGQADAAERNLISGNAGDGVLIENDGTDGNVVAGNFIGTDVTGTDALANGGDGVRIAAGAQDNLIGGTVTLSVDPRASYLLRNRDGNARDALAIALADLGIRPGDVIRLESLGDFAEAVAREDTARGGMVGVFSGSATLLDPSTRERVPDALEAGLDTVTRATFFDALVTDIPEDFAINGATVEVPAGATYLFVGTGDSASGDNRDDDGDYAVRISRISRGGNTIAHNAGAGVAVVDAASTGNLIQANAVYANGALGIDLGGDGVTPNDLGDADDGPNGFQNVPVLRAARLGDETHIVGTVNSTPDTLLVIEFFANAAADPSGHGEGERDLGSTLVRTDAAGNAAFDAVLNAATSDTEFITATATDPSGNTSEFSAAIGMDNAAPHVVSVGPVTPDPRNAAVSSVHVEFDEAIDFRTVGVDDLQLSLNGVAQLLSSSGPLTFTPVDETVVEIGGLETLTGADGAYTLSLDASGVADLVGNAGTGVASDSWLMDVTEPISRVDGLPRRATSLTFAVSVTGADPSLPGIAPSGVASYDIYASVDGAAFALWTTVDAGSPSATFTAQSNHTYAFQSFARDAAGNVESKPAAVEASIFVPDLDVPVTQVTSVDSGTATFVVQFSGMDAGGGGLSFIDVFVQVDDHPAQNIGSVNTGGASTFTGSVTYQAIADGSPHAYRFYTVGVDANLNVENAPSGSEDVLVAANFAAPEQLEIVDFDVQRGADQRSYLRYLDLTFNSVDELQTLLDNLTDGDTANDRIQLERFSLDGSGTGAAVNLAASQFSVSGLVLTIDFGIGGIGGNPNSNVGDGYYQLNLDLDGNGSFESARNFYRLLGDTNGDRVVDSTDLGAINAAIGTSGSNLNQDINGDGVVDMTDLFLAYGSFGRSIGAGLSADD